MCKFEYVIEAVFNHTYPSVCYIWKTYYMTSRADMAFFYGMSISSRGCNMAAIGADMDGLCNCYGLSISSRGCNTAVNQADMDVLGNCYGLSISSRGYNTAS